MVTKTVYVNPGDMINVRIINDPELPKNATEWKYQVRPQNILMRIKGYDCVEFADPAIYCESMGVRKPALPAVKDLGDIELNDEWEERR